MLDSKKENRIALTEGWLSIFLNIFLFGIKYWAGFITGSVAIIADAWHTLTDSISSVIILIGIRISAKPPDEEHPFGHGRAEIIAAIIVSILLAVIGLFFIKESLLKLKSHEVIIFGLPAIIVTIVSVVSKELMAQYAFWGARKTGKKSLKADGWHHRSDAFSSLIILIGIFLGKLFWWIDGVLGFIVAIIIIHAAYEIFKDTINSILGENANEELVSKLEKIASGACSEKLYLHHIHLHNYGNHSELTFHVKFPGETTIKETDKIVHDIKMQIREDLRMEATIESESV
ncbi:cation diffusion facilitator family transporter [Bacteroidota bacterium]